MFRMARIPMGLAPKTLNVYLVDLNKAVELPAPIRRGVHAHFKKVVDSTSKFSGVTVQWTSRIPKLGPQDLVCYFVESRSESIAGEVGTGTLGETGTTRGGQKGTVSEVYLQGAQQRPKGLAAVAFHELMHNIMQIGNGLHTKAGVSMGKEEVVEDTPINAQDLKLIHASLGNKRKQYTDPITRIHDPLGAGV